MIPQPLNCRVTGHMIETRATQPKDIYEHCSLTLILLWKNVLDLKLLAVELYMLYTRIYALIDTTSCGRQEGTKNIEQEFEDIYSTHVSLKLADVVGGEEQAS